MEAEAKQRFGMRVCVCVCVCRVLGGGGYLGHTWHWGEPNHGLAEILTNGEGDGGYPWGGSFSLRRKHFAPVE